MKFIGLLTYNLDTVVSASAEVNVIKETNLLITVGLILFTRSSRVHNSIAKTQRSGGGHVCGASSLLMITDGRPLALPTPRGSSSKSVAKCRIVVIRTL